MIQTERLLLRSPLPADAEAFVDALSVSEVVRQTGSIPNPYTRADADAFIQSRAALQAENKSWTFSIIAEAGAIGAASLTRIEGGLELGYWLARSHWGQGYATEAAAALLDWSRSKLKEDRFVAGHFSDNPASGRVLEKLGFVYVGDMQSTSKARTGTWPSRQYVLNAPASAALDRGHCGHHE